METTHGVSRQLGPSLFPESGKERRLSKIFSTMSQRTVIVPVDDSLIFGPRAGLEDLPAKLAAILEDPPNAILAFPGVFRTHTSMLSAVGGILNLTASTVLSKHTLKTVVGQVDSAVQLALDAVAVHVNLTSKYEHRMLKNLGEIAGRCGKYGLPLLAIMYPRTEAEHGDNNYEDLQANDRSRYAALVAHSARVAADLGATIIKTKYTGDPVSFASEMAPEIRTAV